MAITDGQRLEIHVFGAAKGESIVLRLPSGEWGVVDCYSSSLKDSSTNSTLQFLLDRGVDQLAFLCMTHPHDDHFRGMSHLLDRFNVHCFWRPSVMTGQRLKWIIKSARFDAREFGDETAIEDANELDRIFRLVKKKKQASGKPAMPKSATTGTQLFPVPVNRDAEFQVWALAPSTRQTERYENGLAKCFDESNRLKTPVAQSDHNVVSLALLVVYGNTRIILGGDVETAGWCDVLEEFGAENLSSHGVKISHHGSTNGYADGLWQSFAKQQQPVVFLTSYQRHRLPSKEALDHIRGFSSRILTPCLPAIHAGELPVPLSTKAPVESRRVLHKKLKATSATHFPVGRCSFAFDNAGNCLEETFEGEAGAIPV